MQFPHVPGQDPRASGLPRLADPLPTTDETVPSRDEAEADTVDAEPEKGDAPLGGSEVTEQNLTADTAVEEDALKALDPDDTPA